jgi:Domain of unknown function (DUF222)
MGQLSEIIATLEVYVGAFEPDRLSGDDASHLVALFNKGSRLCAAGRALAAKRAAAANAWKAEGYRSAEEWLAATTKTSRAAAAETLKTAEQIEKLPATREAFVSGRVSAEQAAAVAAAASADPTAEDFMLREADRASLPGLQKTSRALVAAAQKTQAADRERIHRTRYLRSWTSADGAFEGRFRLTPDAGAILLAALDAERRAVFAQARADGRVESGDAYAADALVNLARNSLESAQAGDPDSMTSDPGTTSPADDDQPPGGDADTAIGAETAGDQALADGVDRDPGDTSNHAWPETPVEQGAPVTAASTGDLTTPAARVGPEGHRRRRRGRTPPNVVHVLVDLEALLRGHTNAGETCEAVGVGPVSVATARGAMCDAIVRLLAVEDGRITNICHAGRTIPTKLALALEERDRTCCVPGCDVARHLPIHHLHPVHFLGPTSLSNLARVCSRHHEQITHQGAQLTGTPGNWSWHPPGTNVPYPVATGSGSAPSGADPPLRSRDPALGFDVGRPGP